MSVLDWSIIEDDHSIIIIRRNILSCYGYLAMVRPFRNMSILKMILFRIVHPYDASCLGLSIQEYSTLYYVRSRICPPRLCSFWEKSFRGYANCRNFPQYYINCPSGTFQFIYLYSSPSRDVSILGYVPSRISLRRTYGVNCDRKCFIFCTMAFLFSVDLSFITLKL